MDAIALLEQVNDRASFIKFVEALIEDREEAARLEKENPVRYQLGGANDWQNGTIEGFLGASLAWCDDSDGLPEKPSWRSFAEFLYTGKIYE